MYSTECARLAERHPDLAGTIQKIAEQLKRAGSNGLIRVHEMASLIQADPNQVASVLEKLARGELLVAESMIECGHCRMAAPHAEFLRQHEEEGEYACTSCHRPLTHRAVRHLTAYRHQASTSPDEPLAAGTEQAGSDISPVPEPIPFCVVVTHEGTVHLDEAGYRQLAESASDYEIFADERAASVTKRMPGQAEKETLADIKASYFRIIRAAVEKRGYFDPAIEPPVESHVSGKQTFQRARQTIDIKASGNGSSSWRLFKTKKPENHAVYHFQPEPDCKFALIFLP